MWLSYYCAININQLCNKQRENITWKMAKWNLTMANLWNWFESVFLRQTEDGLANRNPNNMDMWEEAWCSLSSHHHPLSLKMKLGCGTCCSGPFQWNVEGGEYSCIKTEWCLWWGGEDGGWVWSGGKGLLLACLILGHFSPGSPRMCPRPDSSDQRWRVYGSSPECPFLSNK